MDSFRLGSLKLDDQEAVIVGDPCYFDSTPHGYQTVQLGWEAGEYGVFIITNDGQPSALVLSRYDACPTLDELQRHAPAEWLGVDSGQMAMIAASILPTWTESEMPDFNNPQSDYEYAGRATLASQLGANFLTNRAERKEIYASAQTGTAVASSTHYGDGQYALIIARDDMGITEIAVLFDFEDDEGEGDDVYSEYADLYEDSDDDPDTFYTERLREHHDNLDQIEDEADAQAYLDEHGVDPGGKCPNCGHVNAGCTCVPDWTRIPPELITFR